MSHNIFSKYHALIRNLNTDQLIETLEYNALGDCCDVVRAKNIDGDVFLDLTYDQLSSWRNILNVVQITRLWSVVQLAQSKPTAFLISVNEPQTRPIPAHKPFSIGSTKAVGKFPIANALKSILEQKQFGGFPPPPDHVLKQESQPPENPQFHQTNNSYLHTAKDNSYSNQSYNSSNRNQGYNAEQEYENQGYNEIPAYENESFNNPDQNRGYNVPSASNNLQKSSGYNLPYTNQSYSAQSTTKNVRQEQNYSPQINPGYNAHSTYNNLQKNQVYNPPSSNQGYKTPSISNNSQQSQNYDPQFQHKQGYNLPPVGNNQSYNSPSRNNLHQTSGYNPHQRYNHPASGKKSHPIANNPHTTQGYNPRSNQGYNPPSTQPTVNNQRYNAPPSFLNRAVPVPATELIPPPNANNSTNSRSNFYPPFPSNFFPPPPTTIPNIALPRPPTIPPNHDSDDFDSDNEHIPEDRPKDSFSEDYRAQDWYRNISRKEAEALLTGQIDGIFVVRPSRRIEHECTMSIMCNHKIYHLGILKHQGKLLLGNSYFDSINEIVEGFLEYPLVLSGPNNQDIPVILKL